MAVCMVTYRETEYMSVCMIKYRGTETWQFV